jgi:hypothetical protein
MVEVNSKSGKKLGSCGAGEFVLYFVYLSILAVCAVVGKSTKQPSTGVLVCGIPVGGHLYGGSLVIILLFQLYHAIYRYDGLR